MISSIWTKKNKTVKLKILLNYFSLKRSTYYDELHRLHKLDKYAYVENKMKELARESKITYGYYIVWRRLQDFEYYYCPETIRSLTHKLGLIVKVFNYHTTKYSSYRGTVDKIAPNRLH